MMTSTQAQFEATRVYHDFNSLAQLKNKGKDDNPEAIREAAKQFESIFVGMMLKSMRDANAAIVDEPLFDSAQMDMYREMHDEQLTLHLASSKSGLGLTDILVQQLSKNPGSRDDSKVENNVQNTTQFNPRRVSSQPYIKPVNKVQTSYIEQSTNNELMSNVQQVKQDVVTETNTTTSIAKEERGLDFSSPANFVQSLWPYAQQAAKVLQLDPKLLIAQAALETGWGKFVMRTEQGASSKNLFGIKATNNWEGQKTQINTLELEAGTLQQTKAEFRTYDSYAQSFSDYANFISTRNRYQKAMEVASKPESYVKELQAAGYATDPDYANKIGSIYNSPTLNNALKTLVDMP